MIVAILYSDGTQECQRVESLLQSLEQKYIRYELDRDFTPKQFEAEFGYGASYPQVAIGTQHVGTLKDTLNYYKGKGLL